MPVYAGGGGGWHYSQHALGGIRIEQDESWAKRKDGRKTLPQFYQRFSRPMLQVGQIEPGTLHNLELRGGGGEFWIK